MNLIEQTVLAWIALARTVRELFRPGLWAPWAVLAAVQLALLAVLVGFAHPALSWAMAPVLEAVAGPDALRYPSLFRMLPGLYGQLGIVVAALLGAVVIGAGTLLFASRFRGGLASPGEAVPAALRRAAALIVASLPFHVGLVALSFGAQALVAAIDPGPLLRRVAWVAVLGGSVGLQSLFLYLPALIVLERRGPLGALAALPRTWGRGLWSALLLGGLLVLPLLPLHVLASRTSLIVERGTPELVGGLVVAQILVAVLLNFLLCGSATLVYLSAVAPEGERGTA